MTINGTAITTYAGLTGQAAYDRYVFDLATKGEGYKRNMHMNQNDVPPIGVGFAKLQYRVVLYSLSLLLQSFQKYLPHVQHKLHGK